MVQNRGSEMFVSNKVEEDGNVEPDDDNDEKATKVSIITPI